MCPLFFQLCSHCLVFCAFDTLVRLEFFFFFFFFLAPCYVMINLPLGTWRPLAPQRIWRTLCAIPACLDFLSHIQNGHLYSYPILATKLDCLPAFFFSLPGYYLEEGLRQISPNRNQLAVANEPKTTFFYCLFPNIQSRVQSYWTLPWILCEQGCLSVNTERKVVLNHFADISQGLRKNWEQWPNTASGILPFWSKCSGCSQMMQEMDQWTRV